MADQSYLLGKKALGRVAAVVKRVESQKYTDADIKNRGVVCQTGGLAAVVTTAITSFNSNTNTFGTGFALPLIDNYQSNTNTYIAVLDPIYATNGSNSVLVMNNYVNNGTSIPIGQRITVTWRNGYFLFLGSDC